MPHRKKPLTVAGEGRRATRLLRTKTVAKISRSPKSVLIHFSDGTTFYIDRTDSGLDLSITDGPEQEKDW